MLKQALTAAALAAALATPAFAQSPITKPDTAAQSTMPELSKPGHVNFIQQQTSNDWRGSKLIGASVYGPDDKSIGDVNDVLIANDGHIRAVVVGVGGFLGVGEKNVALPFNALHISRKPDSNAIDKIIVSFTKDELNNAPKFAWYEAPKSQTTGSSNSNTSPAATTGTTKPTTNTDIMNK